MIIRESLRHANKPLTLTSDARDVGLQEICTGIKHSPVVLAPCDSELAQILLSGTSLQWLSVCNCSQSVLSKTFSKSVCILLPHSSSRVSNTQYLFCVPSPTARRLNVSLSNRELTNVITHSVASCITGMIVGESQILCSQLHTDKLQVCQH